LKAEISTVGKRARKRIALRLLPFLFLMYIVCYVDRVNVALANLRMSADLGLSDRMYGLGVGTFSVGYLLFEIPGAIVVERWSARKWLARIMITWGLFTILTAFVHTARQFYTARFLVGAAEASFFPGVIVYLTHWFRASDRAKAVAAFFTGLPTASITSSLLASLILSIHWLNFPGWRWLFIIEGIPPIALGLIIPWYLTDRPEEAEWLPGKECEWITSELAREAMAKKRKRNHTIRQAFLDRRTIAIILVWFLMMCGAQGCMFFLPMFIRRLSGLPNSTVALLVAIPSIAAMTGMLLNSWHADKTGERRWHCVIPLACAAIAYLLLPSVMHQFFMVMVLLTLSAGLFYSCHPVLWSMPTLVLSGTAAAASFGLINSLGQLGGLAGPYTVGYLNDRTGSLAAAFGFIGMCYLIAGILVSFVRINGCASTAEPELSKEALTLVSGRS
jgi:MFS transporter, ACS family, tartrate transporter